MDPLPRTAVVGNPQPASRTLTAAPRVACELAATVPGRALFVMDAHNDPDSFADWLAQTRPAVRAWLRTREVA